MMNLEENRYSKRKGLTVDRGYCGELSSFLCAIEILMCAEGTVNMHIGFRV